MVFSLEHEPKLIKKIITDDYVYIESNFFGTMEFHDVFNGTIYKYIYQRKHQTLNICIIYTDDGSYNHVTIYRYQDSYINLLKLDQNKRFKCDILDIDTWFSQISFIDIKMMITKKLAYGGLNIPFILKQVNTIQLNDIRYGLEDDYHVILKKIKDDNFCVVS